MGLLLRIKSKLFDTRGTLDGKALQLLLGTVLGQGVTVLAAPLLTRLFSPEEFGVLGAFVAMVTLFSGAMTLRYELAFPAAKSDGEAFHLLVLCGLSLIVMTLLAFGLMAAVAYAGISQSPWLQSYWYLVPLGLACIGAYGALTSEAVRLGRYGLLAGARVWQACLSAGMQIGAGLLSIGPLGLLLGYIVGQSSGILSVWRAIRRDHRPHSAVDWLTVRTLGLRHRSLPIFSSWSAVLDQAGNGQLLTLMIGAMYGVEYAGYLFLAERVIGRPLLMTANSLLSVYAGEVSRLLHADPTQLRQSFRSVLLRQAGVSLVWVTLTVALLPWLVAPVFGPEWGSGTAILQCMAIVYLPQSILQSVGNTLPMLGHQSVAAAWSIGRVVAVFLAIYVPFYFGFTALHGLIVYVVVQWVSQGSLLFLMRRSIYSLS